VPGWAEQMRIAINNSYSSQKGEIQPAICDLGQVYKLSLFGVLI
jgi:hypothetical protein